MSEQQIQRKITKWLTKEDIYWVKVISATKSGIPDILCSVDGGFVGIEVKTPTTKFNISALQAYNLERIIASGGRAMVAWELEQVKKFIGEMR